MTIYVNTMQEYNNKGRVLVNDGTCYINCCNSIDSLFIDYILNINSVVNSGSNNLYICKNRKQ